MGIVSDTFLQSFIQVLKKRAQRTPVEITDARWACRESAAVLTFFEPGTLRARAQTARVDAHMVLREDIMPAPGMPPSWFLLKTSVRREALQRLGSPTAWVEALAANPERSTDGFQRLYERWLAGTPPTFDEQSYQELTWSAQIASWLEGLAPDLPKVEVVHAMCQRRSVYALFSHLATDTFTGREGELDTLREFVGVLPAGTVGARLTRQMRHWLKISRRDPIVIEGKGGVGKSALLARLLNEHFGDEEILRFPFSYLAFDSPALRIEEPFTLLSECVRQLQLLHSERKDAFAAYQEVVALYRDRRAELEEKTQEAQTRSVRRSSLQRGEEDLYEAFARLVNDLSDNARGLPGTAGKRPFLLVLDTFEEAVFRGRERLIGLFHLLERLHEQCPTFRLLIFTRPPFLEPEDVRLKFTRAPLAELTATESELLLARLGVADPTVAKTVARQIGGNPLNLHLASRVLQSEEAGSGGIEGIKTRSYFFFSVGAEIVRGQLYARLLDHIHDARVRSLAHPGMILRKIDPALIQKVLSGPCEVNVADQADAEALCDALAQEHTLVQIEAPRLLRFRPDIRLPVLEFLRQDRPKQVREIHRAAADYYLGKDGPAERAEGIYHLLALEAESWQLDHHWRPEYGQHLASALEELPPRSQAWLASKLGLNLSDEVRAQASLADWEAITGRKVRDTLRHGRPDEALALLRERSERTHQSALFAYEAKVHIELRQFAEAERVLQKGIASMQQVPSPGRLAELSWLLSQVAELQGKHEQADVALAQAESIAAQIADPLARLQILLQRALLRQQTDLPGEPLESIRQRLAEQLRTMSIEDWHRERSLSRTAAMVLGPGYPELFTQVTSEVGFSESMDRALEKMFGMATKIPSLLGNALSQFNLKLILAAVPEISPESPNLGRLVREFSSRGMLQALAPLLKQLQQEVPLSLGGANLAGIEDYREAWEKELSSEAA